MWPSFHSHQRPHKIWREDGRPCSRLFNRSRNLWAETRVAPKQCLVRNCPEKGTTDSKNDGPGCGCSSYGVFPLAISDKWYEYSQSLRWALFYERSWLSQQISSVLLCRTVEPVENLCQLIVWRGHFLGWIWCWISLKTQREIEPCHYF